MSYTKADGVAILRAIRTRDERDCYWVALLHDPCVYCGVLVTETDLPFHYDHVDPIHHGGSFGLDNIVPACRSCNLKKRTRTLLGHLLCQSYERDLIQARRAGQIGSWS